jgi:hypothetical protein
VSKEQRPETIWPHLDKPKPSLSKQKKRLVVYDFDNTLFHSPKREDGEIAYFDATGEEWPHQGWYGRVETMLPPLVPKEPPQEMWIQDTVDAFRADSERNDTHVVMMTGRPYKWRWRIREILNSNGLVPAEDHYRGCPTHPRGSDTIEVKLAILLNWLFHAKLEIVEVWEDRPEHSSRFMTELKRLKGKHRKTLRQAVVHDLSSGEICKF